MFNNTIPDNDPFGETFTVHKNINGQMEMVELK